MMGKIYLHSRNDMLTDLKGRIEGYIKLVDTSENNYETDWQSNGATFNAASNGELTQSGTVTIPFEYSGAFQGDLILSRVILGWYDGSQISAEVEIDLTTPVETQLDGEVEVSNLKITLPE